MSLEEEYERLRLQDEVSKVADEFEDEVENPINQEVYTKYGKRKLADPGDKLSQWVTGAKQGYEELGRAMENAATNAPRIFRENTDIDETDLSDYMLDESSLSDMEQIAQNWWKKAQHNINQETLRPVADVAATFGGTYGLALLSPFLVEDMGKSIEDEDYVGVAKNAAFFAIPGMGMAKNNLIRGASAVGGVGLMGVGLSDTSKLLGDKNFQEGAEVDPLGTMGTVGMQTLPILIPAVETAYNVRKNYLMEKEHRTKTEAEQQLRAETTLQQAKDKPNVEPQEERPQTYADIKPGDKITYIEEQKPAKPKGEKASLVEEAGLSRGEQYAMADQNLPRGADEGIGQGAFGDVLTFGASDYRGATITTEDIWSAANAITPVRPGGIFNRALGLFRTRGEAIRVRGFKSWSTIAHELGHYASKDLQWGQTPEVQQELYNGALSIWQHREYGSPNSRRGRQRYIEEGRAAFMNEFLINPEICEQHFPEAYREFTTILAQHPEMQERFNLVGERMRAWGNMTTHEQVNSNISYYDYEYNMNDFRQRVGNQRDILMGAAVDSLTSLRNISDDFARALGITLGFGENPADVAQRAIEGINADTQAFLGEVSLMARLFGDNGRVARAFHEDATAVGTERLAALGQKMGVPNGVLHNMTLTEAFRPLENMENGGGHFLRQHGYRDHYEGVSTYLESLHVLEIAIEHGEGYLLPTEYAKAQRVVADAPLEYQEIARRFQMVNENLLEIGVAGHMYTRELVDTFKEKYPHYVPLKRSFAVEGNKSGQGVGSSDTYANITNGLHALSETGSTRAVKDPLATYVLQVQSLMSRIERNNVARAIVRLADRDAGENLLYDLNRPGRQRPDNARQIITVMQNGRPHEYQCMAEGLYEAIAVADRNTQPIVLNAIQSFMQGTAQSLRVGATSTYAFALKNLIVDTLTATLLNRDGKSLHLNIGGREVGISIPIYDQFKLLLDGYQARMDRRMFAEVKAEGMQFTTSIGSGREVNRDLRSTMNRFTGVDDRTMWGRIKDAWDLYLTPVEEGEMLPRLGLYKRARDRGCTPQEAAAIASDGTLNFMRAGDLTKSYNRYTPFFNAVIQGTDKVLRAFREDPIGVGISCFTNLTIPALAVWWLNHDKEWYRNAPTSKKNKYMMIDVSPSQDGSLILTLPKPEFLGMAFQSVPERFLDVAIDKDDTGVVKETLQDTFGQLVPQGTIPPLILSYIEAEMNYNMYRGKPIVDGFNLKKHPKDQYTVYTSEFAKAFGSMTNTSPMIVDNTVYNLTGSAGYMMLGASDWLLEKAGYRNNAPARKLTEYTRFTHEPGGSKTRTSEVFDQGLKRLEADYHSGGTKTKVSKTIKGMRKAKADINKIHKEINDIYKIPAEKMDGKAKRTLLDKKLAKIDKIKRKANSRYLNYKYIQNPQ